LRTVGFSCGFGGSGFFSLRGAFGSIFPEKTPEIKSSLFFAIIGSCFIISLGLAGFATIVSSSYSSTFCAAFCANQSHDKKPPHQSSSIFSTFAVSPSESFVFLDLETITFVFFASSEALFFGIHKKIYKINPAYSTNIYQYFKQ